ncbi:hypothetical protein OK016_11875 [Vibrio chagasii]|nr:hypothetical protein [Vibrio chagasii]
MPDVVYRTEEDKFNAIIEVLKTVLLPGQPSLVVRFLSRKSELLSNA